MASSASMLVTPLVLCLDKKFFLLTQDGDSALILAASSENVIFVPKLIDAGANLDLQNNVSE